MVVYVGDRPCGVDIEHSDTSSSRHSDILYDLVGKKHGISRETLSPAGTGIRLWTQIESWLKLSGCGLKGLYDVAVSHDPTSNEFTLSRHGLTMPHHKDITHELPDNVYGSLVSDGGVIPVYTTTRVSADDILTLLRQYCVS